ncbi:MAG: TIGR01777 family oxidoreductase [Planctomycetaceae bacterium]|nr:TIGR01777 family oxidoreductase [Planctomycetaceae bacterium]
MSANTLPTTGTVAITGASGLVGAALIRALDESGTPVLRLSRRPGPGTIEWDPSQGVGDTSRLEGVAAVVHLAGENIASGRWTDAQKRRIRDSRVEGTRNLVSSLAKLSSPPRVLVCASAIGFYGDRGDELLDESSPPGRGFLADTCREWEAAADGAKAFGARVVQARFGVVLSKDGGALQKMLLPFKLGMGGRIGSGRQYWSWVALPDVVGAIRHAMVTTSLSGPVNVVSSQPATNAEFTKALANVLHRPAVFPMPAAAARLAFGEMADELMLASARVVPRKLEASGYRFQYDYLETALRDALK